MDTRSPDNQHHKSFFLWILLFFIVGLLFSLIGSISSHGEKFFVYIFGAVLLLSFLGALFDYFLSKNRYSLVFFLLISVPPFLLAFVHAGSSAAVLGLITLILLIFLLAGVILFFVRYLPRDPPHLRKQALISHYGKGTLPYSHYLNVSPARYIFMSVITLGIYQNYWCYKNWEYLKNRDNLEIHPFWRGVFDIFFIHELLRKIRTDPLIRENNPAQPDFFTLASVFVAMFVGTIVVDVRIQLIKIFPYTLYLIGLNFLLFAVLIYCLVPVQRYINKGNEHISPAGEYYPWSAGHYILIGLTVLIMVIFHFVHIP